MSERNELIDIEVLILKVNPDSVYITDGKIKTFLPKSQLKDESGEPLTTFVVKEEMQIYLPLWLAVDRDLI